jgi:transcriptional regulator with XRE-family HTH domain
MRARGLTVTALAAAVGISRKHLSNILNGHAPLVEPLLGRLAKAAGVDPVLLRATVRARPKGPLARYGAMRGTIEVLCDPTEPMEHWEMLED